MLAVARDRALDLHNRLLAILEASRVSDAHIAALLFDIATERLFRDLGYPSLSAYGQALQLSPRKTRELVKIAARLGELPALAEAFNQGELAWTKAREVARVAITDTDAAWVEHARLMTCRELERHVAACTPGDPPPDLDDPPKDPPRRRMVFQLHGVEAQVVDDAIAWVMASADLRGEEQDRGAALASLVRRALEAAKTDDDAPTGERYRVVLEHCPTCRRAEGVDAEVNETLVAEACCDAEVVELRPGPNQGHLSRAIPPSVRRTVLHRDRLRCAIPNCNCRLWLDLHHVVAFADRGDHSLCNLVTLCDQHHRLLHEGLLALNHVGGGVMTVEHADGRRTWWELGKRRAHVGTPPRLRGAAAL